MSQAQHAYAGHRPCSDPVQNHSSGDTYPWVIEVVEQYAGSGYAPRKLYRLLGPYWSGPNRPCHLTHADAVREAHYRNRVLSS